MTKYAIYNKWFWNDGIASAEEMFAAQDDSDKPKVVQTEPKSIIREDI